MKWERIVFLNPPRKFIFLPQFFFNVGNSMKSEENIKYWKKRILNFFFQYLQKNTPHPGIIFVYTNFFFNVGNSMKREENMKYWFFFSIFKKFIKKSNNIPSITKTTQHIPMTWCTYLQSFEKIHRCVFELQCKN